MANFVVFIDQEHAKIFELHPSRVEEKSMARHEIRHHTGNEKDNNNRKNPEKFFRLVAERLGDAHEILLIGPGLAKTHFREHLDTHHLKDIGKKVVGLETVDHPTDGQIVALAKKFFKAHLQFE
jgi:stalled ribosome rescue protein Dom34